MHDSNQRRRTLSLIRGHHYPLNRPSRRAQTPGQAGPVLRPHHHASLPLLLPRPLQHRQRQGRRHARGYPRNPRGNFHCRQHLLRNLRRRREPLGDGPEEDHPARAHDGPLRRLVTHHYLFRLHYQHRRALRRATCPGCVRGWFVPRAKFIPHHGLQARGAGAPRVVPFCVHGAFGRLWRLAGLLDPQDGWGRWLCWLEVGIYH